MKITPFRQPLVSSPRQPLGKQWAVEWEGMEASALAMQEAADYLLKTAREGKNYGKLTEFEAAMSIKGYHDLLRALQNMAQVLKVK